MKKCLLVVSVMFFLAGCQNSSTVREAAGANNFVSLEGARLVLKQPLSIGPAKARVFLQNGAAGYGFDSYQPHCAFEIASINHEGAVIEADTFAITRVQGSVQQVVSAEPARLAGLWLIGGLDGGGSQSYYSGYHFWLSSMDQPGVRRMSCYGVYAQPYELYPPTMQEIRQALGAIAEIRQ
jgi:hypothetical protein